jgi:ArsR family transcriptional regulator
MKEIVIMNKKYIVQARIFKAMSDENRLKILELIKEKPRSASELLNEMDFGQSTLSHHMKMMLHAEVVQARKKGKWIIYSLKKEAFEEMKEWMDGYL